MEKIEKRVSELIDPMGNVVKSEFWILEDIANKVNEIVEYINKTEEKEK